MKCYNLELHGRINGAGCGQSVQVCVEFFFLVINISVHLPTFLNMLKSI